MVSQFGQRLHASSRESHIEHISQSAERTAGQGSGGRILFWRNWIGTSSVRKADRCGPGGGGRLHYTRGAAQLARINAWPSSLPLVFGLTQGELDAAELVAAGSEGKVSVDANMDSKRSSMSSWPETEPKPSLAQLSTSQSLSLKISIAGAAILPQVGGLAGGMQSVQQYLVW